MESAAGGSGKLVWLRQCRPLPLLGIWVAAAPQLGPVLQDLTLRGRACPS